jgi:hypothetical protein
MFDKNWKCSGSEIDAAQMGNIFSRRLLHRSRAVDNEISDGCKWRLEKAYFAVWSTDCQFVIAAGAHE